MNANVERHRFESSQGKSLVLDRMKIDGTIQNALASLEFTQVYRNDEATNIEAIYTFPLPVEAILLGLSVTLSETRLVGRVVEREEAATEYEDAIDAGNTAVLLEEIEPGLYAMNVGNLRAGERAEVRMRYALPLRWDQSRLRLALPTTVAPRYGDPIESGVQPYQVPVTELLTENTYELALNILGALSEAEITSPSHHIRVDKQSGQAEISLVDARAFADRDFVLTLTASESIPSSLTLATDGDVCIAHACFHVPDRAYRQKINLKILLDCSGSMAGDSIELAKAGAIHALGLLTADDRYTLSAFGSIVQHDPCCVGDLVPGAFAPALGMSKQYVRQLDAALGGTEMLAALEAVFALGTMNSELGSQTCDVLLITDGETWDRNAIVESARGAGHRIFVVGVGSGPNEALVRSIAEATGGAAAFVGPNEDIVPVIDRHIQRMRTRLSHVTLLAPAEIVWQVPLKLGALTFAGDTVHVFCSLRKSTDEAAHLALTYADGTETTLTAAPTLIETTTNTDMSDLVRIGVAMRLREELFQDTTGSGYQTAWLATQYQIMCPLTNYILVHQRADDAAKTTPDLRLVPQMLTAGWGAAGSVKRIGRKPGLRIAAGYFETRVTEYLVGEQLDWGVVEPSSNAKQSASPLYSRLTRQDRAKFCSTNYVPVSPTPRELVERLNSNCSLFHPGKGVARTLATTNGLIDNQLYPTVLDGLHQLIQTEWNEEDVVIAFWLALLGTSVDRHFTRPHRRAILWIARQSPPPAALLHWVAETLGATNDEVWHWQSQVAAPSPALVLSAPQTV